MSQIIIDMGSGNTCKNDKSIVVQMIDELAEVDTHKHEVIIKWQLFEKAGDNIPLDWDVYKFAQVHAKIKGYQTTASVFDIRSLQFLLTRKPYFIKIANNRSLDWLIGKIPREIKVYVSLGAYPGSYHPWFNSNTVEMVCASKYPAKIEDYLGNGYDEIRLSQAVSDHTIGLDLFKKYQPAIWECHYKLDDSTGLDAGEFAKTPNELREIL